MTSGHHITFINENDAEDFAKLVQGYVISDIKHGQYHVLFEYVGNEPLIERLVESNLMLRERCNRITNRNNELRGKVLRLINNNEELKKSFEIQVNNNITMEHQLDRIKEIVQEVEIEER
jgi:hypothetical protein